MRELGRLVLGGNVFGATASERDSYAVLDAFVDAGGVMVDTADSYAHWLGHGGGESERTIGGWLARRGRRDDVAIATKVGKHPAHPGLSRANITAQLDSSLARLRTDHVDLLYAHADDPAVPLEETLGAFHELVRAGKVREIGASNYTGARLTEALDVAARDGLTPYTFLQPHYNLVERADFETDLAPVCATRGIAVLPYYGLAKGFLTGKYRRGGSSPSREAAARAYETPYGDAVLDVVLEVAAELGTTPGAVALAWLADRPTVAAPIASARTVDQLAELLPVLTLHLTPDQTARLDAVPEPPPPR